MKLKIYFYNYLKHEIHFNRDSITKIDKIWDKRSHVVEV